MEVYDDDPKPWSTYTVYTSTRTNLYLGTLLFSPTLSDQQHWIPPIGLSLLQVSFMLWANLTNQWHIPLVEGRTYLWYFRNYQAPLLAKNPWNTDFSFFYFCDSLVILRNDHLSRGNIVAMTQNFSRNHPATLSRIIPTCRIHFAPGDILQKTTVNHIPLEFSMAAKLLYNSVYRSARYAKITVAILAPVDPERPRVLY